MTEAICSVCGGPPKHAVGHDLPAMTTSATGFCLCGACAVGTLFPSAQASGGRAATPKATGSATAEDEVAAELEKLMGPAPSTAAPAAQGNVTEAELIAALNEPAGQRRPAAMRAPAATPSPKRSGNATAEEEVAAELEKLMGPPRSNAVAPHGDPAPEQSQAVTEEELVAALDDLMGQRGAATARTAASITTQPRLGPQGVAAMLKQMTGSNAA